MKYTKKINIYFTLGLLVVIFGGPLLFAIGLYIKTPLWIKHKTLNKGEFISPSIDFNSLKKKLFLNQTCIHDGKYFI